MSKAALVFWTIAITVLFYMTSHAKADEVVIRGGTAIIDNSPNGASKVFGIRHESDSDFGIYSAQELGGYVDNRGDGRRSSMLLKYQLGVMPGPQVGIFGKVFTGPCVITSPDTVLSSWYQWATDFGFGVRDDLTSLSITYSHISNAGLKLPNQGRDFVVLEMGFAF
jgi:hypothetical protein